MRILCTSIVLVWTVWACAVEANGATAPKDELLSLLDEAVSIVSEPNTLSEMKGLPASEYMYEPNATEAAVKQAVEEPNLLSSIPEPNTLVGQAVETSAAATADNMPVDEARRLRRAFMIGQIEPVETLSTEQRELNLNELIAQVRSLEAPQSPATASAEPKADAPQATPAPEPVSADVKPATEVESKETSEPNALNMLDQLEKSESVVDPLSLADALFRQGYDKQAFAYYQKAAERWANEEGEMFQWVLFQMANCCVNTDPAKAKDLYSELLSRFPNSKWNSSAQSRCATLEWTMSETVQHYTGAGEHAKR